MESGVHGDIRHLENVPDLVYPNCEVHGDIRHLENNFTSTLLLSTVHGDIRHLEMIDLQQCSQ